MAQEFDFTPVESFTELIVEAKELEVDIHERINEVEKAVIDWQYGYYGGFFTALFEALVKADAGNLVNMYRAFPAQTLGYVAYGHAEGWWPAVQNKLAYKNQRHNI